MRDTITAAKINIDYTYEWLLGGVIDHLKTNGASAEAKKIQHEIDHTIMFHCQLIKQQYKESIARSPSSSFHQQAKQLSQYILNPTINSKSINTPSSKQNVIIKALLLKRIANHLLTTRANEHIFGFLITMMQEKIEDHIAEPAVSAQINQSNISIDNLYTVCALSPLPLTWQWFAELVDRRFKHKTAIFSQLATYSDVLQNTALSQWLVDQKYISSQPSSAQEPAQTSTNSSSSGQSSQQDGRPSLSL